MVGLEIRPIAKLYYKRTKGLPTDGKGGRWGEKYFLLRDVIAVVKAGASERGNVSICTLP